MQIFLTILFTIFGNLSAYGIGMVLTNLLNFEKIDKSSRFILGIFVQILLVYLLKILGLSWDLVSIILLPFSLLTITNISLRIPNYKYLEWNFSIWVIVNLCIGLSLITATDGIGTYWANNYGDGAFHIGLISNFTFGNNFPAEYPIYPGEKLSYPFFINLWSAFYWSFNKSYTHLALIFTWQWLLLWILVYNLVKGNKYKVLPWLILLGGGALSLFPWTDKLYQSIRLGYVWTFHLDSFWVTQRNTIFALPLIIAFYKNYYCRNYLFSGLFLSCLVAAHTYFALPCLIVMFIFVARNLVKKRLTNVKLLILGSSISVLNLFWLSSKSSVIKYKFGAPFPDEIFNLLTELGKVLTIIRMNLDNFFSIFLMLILLLKIKDKITISLSFILLTILLNFISFAPWHFDQTKIFLGIWISIICLIANSQIANYNQIKYFLPILIIPGIISSIFLYKNSVDSKIYNKSKLNIVEGIREIVKPDDIMVGEPIHNTLITLAGRKIYSGYPGTLWTHKINYSLREKYYRDIKNLRVCSDKYCPKYLLWTENEKDKFKDFHPEKFYIKTKYPFLFKINK